MRSSLTTTPRSCLWLRRRPRRSKSHRIDCLVPTRDADANTVPNVVKRTSQRSQEVLQGREKLWNLSSEKLSQINSCSMRKTVLISSACAMPQCRLTLKRDWMLRCRLRRLTWGVDTARPVYTQERATSNRHPKWACEVQGSKRARLEQRCPARLILIFLEAVLQSKRALETKLRTTKTSTMVTGLRAESAELPCITKHWRETSRLTLILHLMKAFQKKQPQFQELRSNHLWRDLPLFNRWTPKIQTLLTFKLITSILLTSTLL